MNTTTTKQRPILFSGPMLLALLAGTKTQTRRLVKPQPKSYEGVGRMAGDFAWPNKGAISYTITNRQDGPEDYAKQCPYGQPGDVLWVRETWQPFFKDGFIYLADAETLRLNANTKAQAKAAWPGWKPSIHMPYAACRLWLEVVSVRVERLWDISDADLIAEGMTKELCADIFNAAAGKLTPEDSYYVRSDDKDFTEGHQCYECASRTQRKNKKNGAFVVNEDCPESDGPAYCDDCQRPLLISLTKYGIERELFLEAFQDEPPPDSRENFAAFGLDAAIAGMFAGGIGDLREKHIPQLLRIGYAKLIDAINGKGTWARNGWVWRIEFKRTEKP